MKTIQNMFKHLHWANQRILETLQNCKADDQQVRLFLHILCAEQVWITRLQGKDSSKLPIWSDGDLAACTNLSQQNVESYTTFLNQLAHTDLDNVITYSNSKGEQFNSSIREILTHVALHGQYHRGQINMRLRQAGCDPVSTDYIVFVR
ncbi:DinB family protein [Paenibacillus endoradicis]|uniref:DinB family protein n=1 Tax=Paenibacillus endoradicis TaxID=2972487 RepID=UPI002158B580|nr:DinB family protein [Paenibacillus endoradicis]MCR8658596.1 damage-inducible protein DinB [Paenibacillus endoradicis]